MRTIFESLLIIPLTLNFCCRIITVVIYLYFVFSNVMYAVDVIIIIIIFGF